jgi:hypothetical protein
MIVALAGRRVDAADAAKSRFPLESVGRVSIAVRDYLQRKGATTVVSSAACGADLIGLCEAGKLGLRRRVILPFSREKFREVSVADRPGDWGGLYNRILDEIEAAEELVIITVGDADPYTAASREVLDEAIGLGEEKHEVVGAVMIWDGELRGTPDYTAEFGSEARRRGLSVFEIRTK